MVYFNSYCTHLYLNKQIKINIIKTRVDKVLPGSLIRTLFLIIVPLFPISINWIFVLTGPQILAVSNNLT